MAGVEVDLSTRQAAAASAAALEAALRDAPRASEVRVTPFEDEVRELHALRIERNQNAHLKTSVMDEEFLATSDFKQLQTAAQTFKDLISTGAQIKRGERRDSVNDFRSAMQWLMSDAQRNITKQRYKGLGEMNPEQLWETTMDPKVRRLLRVQIEDAIAADGLFTTLMGDAVEPRRGFIEANALRAGNIDI